MRLAGRIENLVESANVGCVAIDVRVEILETVLIGPAFWNAGECGGAIVEFTFDACVLKFIREKTRDGVGVVLLKRLRPGALEVEERRFRLGLAGTGEQPEVGARRLQR